MSRWYRYDARVSLPDEVAYLNRRRAEMLADIEKFTAQLNEMRPGHSPYNSNDLKSGIDNRYAVLAEISSELAHIHSMSSLRPCATTDCAGVWDENAWGEGRDLQACPYCIAVWSGLPTNDCRPSSPDFIPGAPTKPVRDPNQLPPPSIG